MSLRNWTVWSRVIHAVAGGYVAVSAPSEIIREAALVLSRPDQHVGWRGHSAPADPLALIKRIRGS
jgi:hypothetical protein